MSRRGSIQKLATSEDCSAAATAWLPRDVLAGVLLRLPATDLRRYRRVCKEWHEVISDSDPAFVDEYMGHRPQALTHTIVFFRGSRLSRNGAGYLLDEQWRVTALFTVGGSEDMVGSCNGLLCFLDVLYDAINIVEPFTGESITLPLPPKTDRWHARLAYCLGFDPSSRRYKLLHLSSKAAEQGLYMYTIGEDTSWRSVHVTGAAPDDSYSAPKIVAGAAYWSVTGEEEESLSKLVRLDLATEVIKFRRPNDDPAPFSPAFSVLGVLGAGVCLKTTGKQGELLIGVGARWANSSTVEIPRSRRLTWSEALQRGHLLLYDYGDGRMYAHPIAPASYDLGSGNLVLQMAVRLPDFCKGGGHSNTRGLFVPVPEGGARRIPRTQNDAKTYCYAPPLSPAPLARYFGKSFQGCIISTKAEIHGLSCISAYI